MQSITCDSFQSPVSFRVAPCVNAKRASSQQTVVEIDKFLGLILRAFSQEV